MVLAMSAGLPIRPSGRRRLALSVLGRPGEAVEHACVGRSRCYGVDAYSGRGHFQRCRFGEALDCMLAGRIDDAYAAPSWP